MADYLAHSATELNPNGQSLKVHLTHVSQLCAEFSRDWGEDDGRLCGLYHDIGKYSAAFQRRLNGSGETVDHSSAGARLLFENKNVPAAMCIAGHHAGLADCGTKNDLSGTFMARINRALSGELEDFSHWKDEIPDHVPSGGRSFPGLGNYFYIKMLFSALTDADWLDTEAYYENHPYTPASADFRELQNRLDRFIAPWWNASNEINQWRCQILRAAIDHGEDAPGLFTMTVPTGGGKTVSSMAFALRHMTKYGKKRVIYVIPYCSILEQTRDVFEKIFGRENVLAHYSGAEFSHGESSEDQRALSAENWDAPIILTTAVQFFESLYSNRPGKSRKLHNIAGSVIVFDEAQMLPLPFLLPCVAAICHLSSGFGCTAVLCTATQPALDPLLQEFLKDYSPRELCPEPDEMYRRFQRVQYVDDGTLTDEELADRLRDLKQVLCIVNSRKQAQDLYKSLAGAEGIFHLSTTMIPSDRKNILTEIRRRLNRGEPCRVISTSLIEAGVDVDFPQVYRALAGLDSIIQAGGRCNREGKKAREDSIVHVFRTSARAPRMLEQNISAAERILRRYRQPDSPDAISEYFNFLLYTLKDKTQLDKKSILSDSERLRFETVSENFHIIDGDDYVIYIPCYRGAELVETLRRSGPTRELMRELGQYSVGVYGNFFIQLCAAGAVEQISENAGILLDIALYSPDTGLPFTVSEQDRAIFV